MKVINGEVCLNVTETAAILQCSRSTVWNLQQRGQLRQVGKVWKCRYFRAADVAAIQNGEAPTPVPRAPAARAEVPAVMVLPRAEVQSIVPDPEPGPEESGIDLMPEQSGRPQAGTGSDIYSAALAIYQGMLAGKV